MSELQGPRARRLLLLGSVGVVDDAGAPFRLGGKPLAVLALLALESPRSVSRERLIDAVWGRDPPQSVVNSLQVAVSSIRRGVGPDVVTTVGRGYALGERTAVDAAEFDQALGRAWALRASNPAAARAELVWALGCWRGAALAGLEEFSFAGPAAAMLEEKRLLALERRLELDLALGLHREVVPELENLVQQFPEREALWALQVRALGMSGRQSQALASYQSARMHLLAEFGVEPGPVLRQAQAAVLNQEEPAPLDVSTFAQRMKVRATVPQLVDDTYGREADVDAVSALVTAAGRGRLVTITGPGGVGKTRLGLEVTLRTQDTFRDGAAFVSLAEAQKPHDVLPAICTALGFSAGDDAKASLQAALAGLEMLLVCDNAEHVAEAAADLAFLVASHPALRLLVTSRQPLKVRGEQCYPLEPLSLVAAGGAMSPAAQMLRDRVRAADPRLLRDDGDSTLLAKISERCDGLPLALEFAAARAPLLGLAGLSAELDVTAAQLSALSVDVPDRHRSLQANLTWSLSSLEPAAVQLLTALVVFEGGFTASAAGAVADLRTPDCLALLDTLRRRSLISRVTATSQVQRFALLRTTRDFLIESIEPDAVMGLRHRHADYFRALLGPVPVGVTWPERSDEWWGLVPERANIRAAIRWALDNQRHELGADLVCCVHALWDRLGPVAEHQEWLTLLSSNAHIGDIRRSDILIRLSFRENKPTATEELTRAALELLKGAAEPDREMFATAVLLWKRDLAGTGSVQNLRAARELVARADTEHADVSVRHDTLVTYGLVLVNGGHDQAEGGRRLREAYDLADSREATFWVLQDLNNLAEVALSSGDMAEARALAEAGIRLAHDRFELPSTRSFEFDMQLNLLSQLGVALVNLDEREEGFSALAAALDGHLRIGDEYAAAEDLLRIAWGLASTDLEQAAHLFAVQDAIRKASSWPLDQYAAALDKRLREAFRINVAWDSDARGQAEGSLRQQDNLSVLRQAAQRTTVLRGKLNAPGSTA